jgi:hypothetical protein
MFGSLDGFPLLSRKCISLGYELIVLLPLSLTINAIKVIGNFRNSQC